MSEHYFYHPDHGLWVTVSDVDQDTIDGYPTGTVEISADPNPGPNRTFNGTEWVTIPPTYEEKSAAIWARFNNQADSFVAQLSRAKLFDGASYATAEARIQAAYAAAITERNNALDALDAEG